MKRRKFLGKAGAALVAATGTGYLFSDRRPFVRSAMCDGMRDVPQLTQDEEAILYLASLAPSGHNTQPWLVKYLEPNHWIIANDRTRWLPVVDPLQRETILSIGAFIQNMEYAAGSMGYQCDYEWLALDNQSEDIMEVKLARMNRNLPFDRRKIERRRTVRGRYQKTPLSKEDVAFITEGVNDYFQYFPPGSKQSALLNEQTIEANKLQTYQDDAQSELAAWMRLSSRDAKMHCDGLTTASMEIEGLPGWIVRNFYTRSDVMSKTFREQGLDKVRDQVGNSGGWLLLTSKDNSTQTLIETGMRLQRMWLRIWEKQIAIHPMTQVLEEAPWKDQLNTHIGGSDPVQFVIRAGYLKDYPRPVSLRRPAGKFVTFNS